MILNFYSSSFNQIKFVLVGGYYKNKINFYYLQYIVRQENNSSMDEHGMH